MKNIRFYKTTSEKWYADLPEWKGSLDELEMVCGADTMLDILSFGENEVWISMSTKPFLRHTATLKYVNKEADGANYVYLSNFNEINVWLCSVTEFVFGDFPKIIYLK